MKRLTLLLCLLTGLCVSVFAQDKIYTKGGKIIDCKILEIGIDEIKYQPSDNLTGPVYNIAKDKIKKIVFENGKTETYETSWKDKEQYADELHKAVKIDFLGPLLGYTQISYEKSLKPGHSYELSLGIIGAGKNQHIDFYDGDFMVEKRNQFGVFASAGYKFNKLPDFLFGRSRMSHLMQGAYAKPIVYLGNYAENIIQYKANQQYVVERQHVTFGALQIELGKQWVFGEKFLLDAYWGFGYGADNKKNSDYSYDYHDNSSAYNYANVRAGSSPGFSLTFGLKAGLLIK